MKRIKLQVENWLEILKSPVVISQSFEFDGAEWEIWLYPRGAGVHKYYYASMFLCVKHPHRMQAGWTRRIRFRIEIKNRKYPSQSIGKRCSTVCSDVAGSRDEVVAREPFSEHLTSFGVEKLIKLSELDEERGWLQDGAFCCHIELSTPDEGSPLS